MTDWQPIETAPKDGTPILLFCGDGFAVGEWRVKKGVSYWEIAHEPILGIVIPVKPDRPTHWQRLPDPPK